MPHCEPCDRFYNPNSLSEQGCCPTCGYQVADIPEPEKVSRFGREGAPWHFKLLIGITVVYLGYRFVQLLVWAVHSI